MKLTQDKIELLEAILDGEEFVWGKDPDRYFYDTDGIHCRSCDGTYRDNQYASDFLADFTEGRITLPPKPLEPLSDMLGRELWMWISSTDEYEMPPTVYAELSRLGVICGGITALGKRLLGEWLVRTNGGSE